MMDRRQFVQACAVMLGSGVMVAGCGSGGGSSSESGTTTGVASDSSLSRSRWEELPSTSFSVTHDTFGAIDMELTAIDDEIPSSRAEQFSVVLTGPDNPLFPEGTYQVYNDSLGYIELYLQPGDNAAGQQNYRAVFSLIA